MADVRSISRSSFTVLVLLFVAGVAVQVFLAGLSVLGGQPIDAHVGFVHALEFVPLLMLAAALVGRLGRRAWVGSVALFLLVSLQYAFVAFDAPALRALHAVNALAIFGLGMEMARAAWQRRGAAA